MCATGLAVVAEADAQTTLSRMAYRADFVDGPFDCESGCYWDVGTCRDARWSWGGLSTQLVA